MKNQKTAAGSFSALFRNTCKRTCFVPIITFLLLFISTLSNYIQIKAFNTFDGEQFVKDRYFGFFWNGVYHTSMSLAEVLIIIGAVLAGIIAFSFAQSKKQCNESRALSSTV